MTVNAKNARAIRRKAAAETPFMLHKKGEHLHRWESWDPNFKTVIQQEITIEMFKECTVAPRADGKVEVTTTNQRLMSQLDTMHRMEPGKCTGRNVTTGVAIYTVDAEAWKTYLTEHTEAEAQKEDGAEA